MQIYNKQWKWSKWDLDWSANKVDGSCPGTSFLLLNGWISIRWKVHVLVTLIPRERFIGCKALSILFWVLNSWISFSIHLRATRAEFAQYCNLCRNKWVKIIFLCVILSECLIINSVSVARWTKASTWREKEAQMFIRGHNLFQDAKSSESEAQGKLWGVLSPLRWIVVHYFILCQNTVVFVRALDW